MRQTILLPASVGIAVLLACALALLAALAAAPAASAASFEHGASFAVRCNFSHQASVDPIVFAYPLNPVGAEDPPYWTEDSHSHDFLGNKTTDYNSTYDSMSKLDTPTTCSRPEDTAGYWFPTLSWNGVEKHAYRVVFYYRAGGKDHTEVQPFAKDLRIIADKGVNGARVRWYCGGGGSNDDKSGSADPPTRCSSGVLGLRIIFPDCVESDLTDPATLDPVPSGSTYRAEDGITRVPDPKTGKKKVIAPENFIAPDTGQVRQVIDTDDFDNDIHDSDHRLHMVRSKAQSDGTRVCPSTYIPVPTLTINANFDIGTSSGNVTLSSGDASTIHTDFWNTWDQDAPWKPDATDGGFGGLKALVEHCINAVPPEKPRPVPCQAPTATA
jgi:hypothetical protein